MVSAFSLLLAFAFSSIVFCASLESAANHPKSKTCSCFNLEALADVLIAKIFSERVPRSIPSLLLASKGLRERMLKFRLLQHYLAEKYDFSPLINFPFDSDLYRVAFFGMRGYLTPVDLFYCLKQNFQHNSVFERIFLELFDYFQAAPTELDLRVSNLPEKPGYLCVYSQFIVDVVLNNRSLECFVRSRKWLKLGIFKFGSVPNLTSLLSKWFLTEYATFKRTFFSSRLLWSRDFLVAFLKAEATFFPSDLTSSESFTSNWQLDHLLCSQDLRELIPEQLVAEKCRQCVDLLREVNEDTYLSFHARFNPNFNYRVVPEPLPEREASIVALGFVLAGRFDDAIAVMREMKEIQNRTISFSDLELPDFLIYLLPKDPELGRFHFYQLPESFYVDPELVGLVWSFYGSLDEYIESTEGLLYQHGVALYNFIIRNGTLNQFKAILSKVPVYTDIDFLKDFAEFRQNDPNFEEYVKLWFETVTFWINREPFPCNAKFLKAAFAHPAVFCYLEHLDVSISALELAKLLDLPEYQVASEEIIAIITGFIRS